jgi:hypothetical protein
MSQPESRLVEKIRSALEGRGCVVVKIHGSRYMPEGFPDLVVVLPGGSVAFVEVKVPGRVDGPAGVGLSAMQLRWLWKLGSQGAVVGWADTVEDAVSIVERGGSNSCPR